MARVVRVRITVVMMAVWVGWKLLGFETDAAAAAGGRKRQVMSQSKAADSEG